MSDEKREDLDDVPANQSTDEEPSPKEPPDRIRTSDKSHTGRVEKVGDQAQYDAPAEDAA